MSHLQNHRIWIYSGGKDSIVKPSVVDAVEVYYKALVKDANVHRGCSASASVGSQCVLSDHSMPTETFGGNCSELGDPYIRGCGFDAAGELLKWIYGALNAKTVSPLGGKLLEFGQKDFVSDPGLNGMADAGWVFVPDDCAAQKP